MTSVDGYKGCDYDEHSKQAERIHALTAERDAYILKQKVWEEANDELRSADIVLRRQITTLEQQVRKLKKERNRYKKALRDIVALYDNEDTNILDFLNVAEQALKNT